MDPSSGRWRTTPRARVAGRTALPGSGASATYEAPPTLKETPTAAEGTANEPFATRSRCLVAGSTFTWGLLVPCALRILPSLGLARGRLHCRLRQAGLHFAHPLLARWTLMRHFFRPPLVAPLASRVIALSSRRFLVDRPSLAQRCAPGRTRTLRAAVAMPAVTAAADHHLGTAHSTGEDPAVDLLPHRHELRRAGRPLDDG